MLADLAAASPTPHATPAFSHLGPHLLHCRHRLLSASTAAPAGAGRGRHLLAGAFASGDGGAGQDVDSSENTASSGSAYIGLFVRMLGLDNDTRDRKHAVCTIWQYSLGGRKCIDEIMQFPGCIIIIISLLKSESARAIEAAVGLLHNITSVKLYRDVAIESGAMEEILSLLCKSTITPVVTANITNSNPWFSPSFHVGCKGYLLPYLACLMKEQGLCTIWSFSIDENLRYKILWSDILIQIVTFLDDEDIKVKEAAADIISNLALSRSNHGALVEAGVIPKLVPL